MTKDEVARYLRILTGRSSWSHYSYEALKGVLKLYVEDKYVSVVNIGDQWFCPFCGLKGDFPTHAEECFITTLRAKCED